MSDAREQIEKQLQLQNAGKTPDQIIQESYDRTKATINNEKISKEKEVEERVGALRAMFNTLNPIPSNRFKK
jgi:hypothetical protein